MSERGAIVVGASSGVGRAIADQLASDGWRLVIASRTGPDLDAVARDLRLRHNVEVTVHEVDVTGPDEELQSFIDRATAALPSVDAVLLTVGAVAAVDSGTDDWATASTLLDTNFGGVIKIAGKFVGTMEETDRGTVVLFSSIAAAAPRDRNVVYAAAKAGLESFGKSMQHRLAGSRVSMQIYALGYVDTAMSQGQQLRLPPADPAKVARRVVSGLNDGSKTVYEPRWWGLIVRVLRALPWPIYRRLKF